MTKKIVLGGGCFWGMQDLIRKQQGIVKTTVGYAGGKVENPTYKNHEGHAEVVQIEYDPEKTSLVEILDFFFQIHDPTTINRQGNDIGSSYRSVVFFGDASEKEVIAHFIDIVNASKKWENPVITSLEPLTSFTNAEEYHQDYLVKNPEGYTCHFRRFGSYL